MQIVLNNEQFNGFYRFQVVNRLDKATRKQAEMKFSYYQQQGVVKNAYYEDDEWFLNDEIRLVSLQFDFDDCIYETKALEWTGCTASCFKDYLKAYMAFQIGNYALERLRQINRAILQLSELSYEEAEIYDYKDIASHVIAFLRLLPEESLMTSPLAETIEDYSWQHITGKKSRQLADFKYYLRFNRAVSDFWKSSDIGEKHYYFPVWFWWNLTSILPLRVTEFLMTPRDCLRKEGSHFFLSVRRTYKKKGLRKVFYKVAQDYTIHEYEIPEWFYKEILTYQTNTMDKPGTSLETLLIPENADRSSYFTYSQMANRLHRFCRDFLGDSSYPVNLGDTRHLSMISLILSGGSPVICRELAGHENIDISANYYGNLSSVVESAVYESRHGYSDASFLSGIPKYPVGVPKSGIRVTDGWCDVQDVANGNITECMKSYRPGAVFGECRNCLHYFPDDPGIKVSIKKAYQEAVDSDGIFLMQMIELVRKGRGCKEDIDTALKRIQNSVHRYGNILIRDEEE